jgi:hypothetical protein
MIDFHELAIGSYFHPTEEIDGKAVPLTKVIEQVGSLNKLGEVGVMRSDGEPIVFLTRQLAPVLLSREILERCGFQSETHFEDIFTKEDLKNEGLSIEVRAGFLQPVTMNNDCFIEFGKPIAFLHQLQNLYLAVTGKQLNFSPSA